MTSSVGSQGGNIEQTLNEMHGKYDKDKNELSFESTTGSLGGSTVKAWAADSLTSPISQLWRWFRKEVLANLVDVTIDGKTYSVDATSAKACINSIREKLKITPLLPTLVKKDLVKNAGLDLNNNAHIKTMLEYFGSRKKGHNIEAHKKPGTTDVSLTSLPTPAPTAKPHLTMSLKSWVTTLEKLDPELSKSETNPPLAVQFLKHSSNGFTQDGDNFTLTNPAEFLKHFVELARKEHAEIPDILQKVNTNNLEAILEALEKTFKGAGAKITRPLEQVQRPQQQVLKPQQQIPQPQSQQAQQPTKRILTTEPSQSKTPKTVYQPPAITTSSTPASSTTTSSSVIPPKPDAPPITTTPKISTTTDNVKPQDADKLKQAEQTKQSKQVEQPLEKLDVPKTPPTYILRPTYPKKKIDEVNAFVNLATELGKETVKTFSLSDKNTAKEVENFSVLAAGFYYGAHPSIAQTPPPKRGQKSQDVIDNQSQKIGDALKQVKDNFKKLPLIEQYFVLDTVESENMLPNKFKKHPDNSVVQKELRAQLIANFKAADNPQKVTQQDQLASYLIKQREASQDPEVVNFYDDLLGELGRKK